MYIHTPLLPPYEIKVLYNIKLGKVKIFDKIRIWYLNYSCISLYEKDTGQANQYMKSQSSFWANFNWSSMQLLSACFRQRTPFHIYYITLCERRKIYEEFSRISSSLKIVATVASVHIKGTQTHTFIHCLKDPFSVYLMRKEK